VPALDAAKTASTTPKGSHEEVMAIVQSAQKAFAKSNASHRDLLQELVYTADQAWTQVDVGCKIHLIRERRDSVQ
jgi:hypothetical protein